ncbi:MarR family winged helix-turn-helix transcriptional regulator [Marinitenerispora sediminis]|uniref:MarR family transcriptional regulator n=1 Tax=Marinitenerispora sediminis TaxID=1931232 RepID=A0A368T3B5_9ACTN|nr:MarR family transcriptional regulator [Marinitenerispora sediminis]RCV49506.1 MarR family transcriptional regulator [Marinitenerispora sediminis]RCV52591.1 MarR family transcriptional regulator [Marinitenerispora sediminis]RCV56865.1 MarR family transcriptional regulator [Marinitenerispora sediminis]
MATSADPEPADPGTEGAAFLLTQLGSHAAARFAERVAEIGVSLRQAGLLRWIGRNPGRSQRELAEQFGVRPSRVVVLVDELERQGLIRRAPRPGDRRTRLLELTEHGRRTLRSVGTALRRHEDEFLAALTPAERTALTGLLERVAAHQGIGR